MKAPFTREQRDQLKTEVFHRELVLDRAGVSTDSRTVPASMSSEQPVRRWFGNEILSHSAESINLGRANDGQLPMLFGHDTDVLIGAASDFKVADKRLSGTLRFAEATTAPHVWEQIREGMPLGISIGYRIDEWTESANSDDVTVTRWTLHEVSVVTVPADSSVGINRSLEETASMPEITEEGTAAIAAGAATNSVGAAAAANVRLVAKRAHQEGMQAQLDRINAIREMFLAPGFQSEEFIELERIAIDNGLSVEDTRAQILDLVGSGIMPVATTPLRTLPAIAGPSERFVPQSQHRYAPRQDAKTPHVTAGRDQRDGYREGALEALCIRAGLEADVKVIAEARRGNEFMGMSLVELARECLARQGVNTRGLDAKSAVGIAFTTPGSFVRGTISTGVSDFANILLDAANKALSVGWVENDETYTAWTRSMPMSDFKTHNLVNLSNFGDLDVVPEYAEYKYGSFSDVKETITLRTYGKLFNLSRQAIINDDTSVFTTIPTKMGRAAARMVGDECYAVLTGNPTMNQDSLALFHATHGNYVTSGGSAPSVTSLDALSVAMGTRTDPGGATLNLRPRYLIVPLALENTAKVLMAAEYDPSASAGTLKPNPFRGTLEVISDARLDAFNAAGWFAAADSGKVGTVVVGFLNGSQAPYIEQQTAFSQDGVQMKVRLDCRAAAEDFRGLYYNDGA